MVLSLIEHLILLKDHIMNKFALTNSLVVFPLLIPLHFHNLSLSSNTSTSLNLLKSSSFLSISPLYLTLSELSPIHFYHILLLQHVLLLLPKSSHHPYLSSPSNNVSSPTHSHHLLLFYHFLLSKPPYLFSRSLLILPLQHFPQGYLVLKVSHNLIMIESISPSK